MDKDLIEYFIKATDERFKKTDQRFDQLDSKLDILFKFKWQIVGMSSLAGVLASAVVVILAEMMRA